MVRKVNASWVIKTQALPFSDDRAVFMLVRTYENGVGQVRCSRSCKWAVYSDISAR